METFGWIVVGLVVVASVVVGLAWRHGRRDQLKHNMRGGVESKRNGRD